MAKQYSKKESDMEVMMKFCENRKNKEYGKITMDDIKKIEPEKIECFANMLREGVPEQYVELPIRNARYFGVGQICMISHAGIAWANGRAKDNTAFLCMQNPYLDAFMMYRADNDARNGVPPEEIRKYLEEASKTENYFKQEEIREESILKLSEQYPQRSALARNFEPTKDGLMRNYLAIQREQILKDRAHRATENYKREHLKREEWNNEDQQHGGFHGDIYKELKVVCQNEKPEAEKEQQYTEDAIFNNGDTSKWDRSENNDTINDRRSLDLPKEFLDELGIELK